MKGSARIVILLLVPLELVWAKPNEKHSSGPDNTKAEYAVRAMASDTRQYEIELRDQKNTKPRIRELLEKISSALTQGMSKCPSEFNADLQTVDARCLLPDPDTENRGREVRISVLLLAEIQARSNSSKKFSMNVVSEVDVKLLRRSNDGLYGLEDDPKNNRGTLLDSAKGIVTNVLTSAEITN